MDPTLAQIRLDEANVFAGHVEAVAQMHLDTRKSEALWLMTSKSIARALDFDAKVVHPEKMRPLAKKLGEETKKICEKIDREIAGWRHLDKNEAANKFGRNGYKTRSGCGS